MENSSLYTKYRPARFSEVCGQESTVEILKNQIKSRKISHAYLFSGTRGTGKTTCARIFARAINCLDNSDGEPCYNCSMCNEHNSILSIVELDAASNNSVDQIRALIEELKYSNFVGGYKIYILDEVHMLSISAFNALLKTLEEPPKNIVFILSTTEIKKIPQTIVSRCQRFEFKNIDLDHIKDRLKYIIDSENVNVDSGTIDLISRLSDGSMRDAISILERVLLASDNITLDVARKILGVTSHEIMFSLMKSIKNKDLEKSLFLLDDVFKNNINIRSFVNDLRNLLRDIMFLKINKNNLDVLIEKNSSNINNIIDLSDSFDFNEIYSLLDSMNEINAKKDLDDIEYRIYLEIFLINKYKSLDFILDYNSSRTFDGEKNIEISNDNSNVIDSVNIVNTWNEFLTYLRTSKQMVLYSLLTNGVLESMSHNKIFFKCTTEGIFNRLNKEETLRDIKINLNKFFKHDVDFELVKLKFGQGFNINEKLKGYFGENIEIENK